jgi:hypothetical protein
MATSLSHQKQKLPLSKSHRLARSIVRQFIPLSQLPIKRIGFVGVGVIAGVGVPALVFAAQQQAVTVTPKAQSNGSSTLTIESSAASQTGAAFSLSESSAPPPNADSDPQASTNVTVNGEEITTEQGSVSRHYVSNDGSNVDVNVTIDNSSTSSSNTSTNISIISSSSTSDSADTVRGSPRR